MPPNLVAHQDKERHGEKDGSKEEADNGAEIGVQDHQYEDQKNLQLADLVALFKLLVIALVFDADERVNDLQCAENDAEPADKVRERGRDHAVRGAGNGGHEDRGDDENENAEKNEECADANIDLVHLHKGFYLLTLFLPSETRKRAGARKRYAFAFRLFSGSEGDKAPSERCGRSADDQNSGFVAPALRMPNSFIMGQSAMISFCMRSTMP